MKKRKIIIQILGSVEINKDNLIISIPDIEENKDYVLTLNLQ